MPVYWTETEGRDAGHASGPVKEGTTMASVAQKDYYIQQVMSDSDLSK